MRQIITHLLKKHNETKNINQLYNSLILFKNFFEDEIEFDRQLMLLCGESVMNELKRIDNKGDK